LIYRTPELLSKEYYLEAKMSKFLATIIDSLNHDIPIGHVLSPTEKIHILLEKYKNKITF
jgi:ribose-phosphate pyrophosphokinase